MESRWNSRGIFHLDSPNCKLCYKVQEFMSKMSEKPEEFTGRIIFMSMFNDISWGSQDNDQECELNEKTFTRKMVIPWTWNRKEVVFYL